MDIAFFVIDSVLFDNRHRQHLVTAYKQEDGESTVAWDEYWARSLHDTPLPALTIAAALLNQGAHLVLTSGRPASMLADTEHVIATHLLGLNVDPDKLANIRYELRQENKSFLTQVNELITELEGAKANLIIGIVKNNGLASQLRRHWPYATVCNMTRGGGM